MSGIAGHFRLDGGPARTDVVELMLAAMSRRGEDGVGSWHHGSVALGHALLRTTIAAAKEHQPLADPTQTVCVTFDGRVDNRGELLESIPDGSGATNDSSDAGLVLRAYLCWGFSCPERILGDFAFGIWDGRSRSLFCARDPLGIKSFYYHVDGRSFRFASELRAILADSAVPARPHEGVTGEFLAGQLCSVEETLVEGVVRLPGGHSLVVTPQSLGKRRYWDIDPSRTLSCATDGDYAEHFLEIFRSAVSCRLSNTGRGVAVQLSGGLDSSAIISIAAALHDGSCSRGTVEAFSLTFPGLDCDERVHINEVVDTCGLVSHLFRGSVESLATEVGDGCAADWPLFPSDAMFTPLRADMHQRGFRVVLSGEGGDSLFSGLYHPYTDLMKAWRLTDLGRQIRLDAARFGALSLPSLLYWHALRPMARRVLPARVADTLRHMTAGGVPPWLDAGFARRISLEDRLHDSSHVPPGLNRWQRTVRGRLVCGWQAFYNDVADQAAGRFAFDYRHPFFDSRVAEFAAALPLEQCWRRTDRKIVIPLAMRGIMAESIRTRTTKAEFSELVPKALADPVAAEFDDSWSIAAEGWVRPAVLRSMRERMIRFHANADKRYIPLASALSGAMALEQWYRATFVSRQCRPCAQAVVNPGTTPGAAAQ